MAQGKDATPATLIPTLCRCAARCGGLKCNCSFGKESIIMNRAFVSAPAGKGRESLSFIELLLVILLLCSPAFTLLANAQARGERATKKLNGMNENQRIAHVLSRLTYGAR